MDILMFRYESLVVHVFLVGLAQPLEENVFYACYVNTDLKLKLLVPE